MRSLLLLIVVPLAACGSTAPPVAGNMADTLTDSRGAHAGSFHAPDNGAADDGNAAQGEPETGGNAQGNTQ